MKEINHLKQALKIAQNMSKDPSTKVGAIFYDEKDVSPIVFGYNGMPRGMNDQDPEKNKRPEKYLWYEHAERNGIYNAAQSLAEGSIAFCSHCPSMEGARALVSSGIKRIFINHEDKLNLDKKVEELFNLCNIAFAWISLKTNIGSTKYKKYLDFAIDFGITESDSSIDKKSGILILKEESLTPLGAGANRAPEGLHIEPHKLMNKETIHQWIQEPEKDAIFGMVRPKLRNSLVYVSWCPCSRCSLAMVSIEAKKVITVEPDFTQEADLRWKAEFDRSQSLLKDCNIDLKLIEKKHLI